MPNPNARSPSPLNRYAVILLAAVMHAPSAVAQSDGPPSSWTKGVNVARWFTPGGGSGETHLLRYFTRSDADLLTSIGMDHVRLPVDPALVWNRFQPDRLNAGFVDQLDAAIERLAGWGLAVVIDIHPSDDFKIPMRDDDEYVGAVAGFWTLLAKRLSHHDPSRVALELCNEPIVRDHDRWQVVVQRLHAAVRSAAPHHTIIVAGANWSDIDDLVRVEPLDDPNVIYTFHMYTPHTFTHQGATWGQAYWKDISDLEYPAVHGNATAVASRLPDNGARRAVLDYRDAGWNARAIGDAIAVAAGWADRHRVRLYCGEFGAYKLGAPPASRARYLGDVRSALESHGIGWAMWDYNTDFALVDDFEGSRRVADPIIDALGLIPAELRIP